MNAEPAIRRIKGVAARALLESGFEELDAVCVDSWRKQAREYGVDPDDSDVERIVCVVFDLFLDFSMQMIEACGPCRPTDLVISFLSHLLKLNVEENLEKYVELLLEYPDDGPMEEAGS